MKNIIRKIIKAFFALLASLGLIIVGLTAIYIVNSYLRVDIDNIYSAINNADKLTITVFKNGKNEVIYTTKNIKDIQAYKKTLKLEEKIEWSLLACRGKVRATLYKNKRVVSAIVYLPEKRIREEVIGYNLRIKELKNFQIWLKEKGINLENYLKCNQ